MKRATAPTAFRAALQLAAPELKTGSLSFAANDADQASRLFTDCYVPLRVGGWRGGALDIQADMFRSHGVCVSSTVCPSGSDFQFHAPFDGYGLTLLSSGGLQVRHGTGTPQQSSRDAGLMFDCLSVSRAALLPGTAWERLTADADDLHSRLQALTDRPVAGRIRFTSHVEATSSVARMASAILDAFRHGTSGDAPLLRSPAALASLRETALQLLLEGLPHNYTADMARRTRQPSPGNVKRAVDFMHSHAKAPLQLEDVARAAGTSPRALQSAFRRFKGVTPMQYLRRVRLAGARADLLTSTSRQAVGLVALAWGFPHAGSFAAYYRQAYGESPSATVRRLPV